MEPHQPRLNRNRRREEKPPAPIDLVPGAFPLSGTHGRIVHGRSADIRSLCNVYRPRFRPSDVRYVRSHRLVAGMRRAGDAVLRRIHHARRHRHRGLRHGGVRPRRGLSAPRRHCRGHHGHPAGRHMGPGGPIAISGPTRWRSPCQRSSACRRRPTRTRTGRPNRPDCARRSRHTAGFGRCPRRTISPHGLHRAWAR